MRLSNAENYPAGKVFRTALREADKDKYCFGSRKVYHFELDSACEEMTAKNFKIKQYFCSEVFLICFMQNSKQIMLKNISKKPKLLLLASIFLVKLGVCIRAENEKKVFELDQNNCFQSLIRFIWVLPFYEQSCHAVCINA